MSRKQWVSKGFPTLVSDAGSLEEVGGPSKIDSVQNIITLRNDLRDAWDKYEFSVDPDVHLYPVCAR
jgi:hypothetical protein